MLRVQCLSWLCENGGSGLEEEINVAVKRDPEMADDAIKPLRGREESRSIAVIFF